MSQNWWILEHFWCILVLLENVIFSIFKNILVLEAHNTGMQKWCSTVQYLCTSIWDLKYTFFPFLRCELHHLWLCTLFFMHKTDLHHLFIFQYHCTGWILIDRSGKHFGTILNYLRDGHVPIPEAITDIEELHAEAKYYLVSGLVDKCNQAIKRKKDECNPVCRIPVITSQKEAQMLIHTSVKPIVKLLYNRQNNKYSYTR